MVVILTILQIILDMLSLYKQFCCGIYSLLKEKANSDIPIFATYMFTLFLFVLLVFGVDSLIFLVFKTTYQLSREWMYCMVLIFAIPNYFLVFKSSKFLEFYKSRLSHKNVIFLILLIFISSLTLILIGGVRNTEI